MSNLRVTIENKTEGSNFMLKIAYYSKKGEIPFRFQNAWKIFEARDLKIADKTGKVLEQDGNGHLSPKNWDEIHTKISESKPFIYEMKGVITEFGDNSIYLNFITAGYILKTREPYYFYFVYEDEQSEKIEIVF